MIEPRFDATVPAGDGADGRQPFVPPRIEEMGGLRELTLVGASI